jgi:hydrogenase maturation protein HypF
LQSFERVGHFSYVGMPGGTAAIRQPWRMSAAYLDAIFGDLLPDNLDVVRRNPKWPEIIKLLRARINTPLTSSVGRLFDAVAAIIGSRDSVNFEGQAAIELEQLANPSEYSAYDMAVPSDEPFVIDRKQAVRAVVDDLHAMVPKETIAARFHNTLAKLIIAVCRRIRSLRQLDVVALSGGVFQNMFLLERTLTGLEANSFRVLTHHRVPCNDSGISFGQTAIAAACDRSPRSDRAI